MTSPWEENGPRNPIKHLQDESKCDHTPSQHLQQYCSAHQ